MLNQDFGSKIPTFTQNIFGYMQGVPEITDSFNFLITQKLR